MLDEDVKQTTRLTLVQSASARVPRKWPDDRYRSLAARYIDVAVTVGFGSPKVPLALGDKMGASTVLSIVKAIIDCCGDTRQTIRQSSLSPRTPKIPMRTSCAARI